MKYKISWDEVEFGNCALLIEAVCRYCNQREEDYKDIEASTIMAILGIEKTEENKKTEQEEENG